MPIPEKPNVRTLPPAPQRSQMPLDYAQTADAWAAAWQGFSTEISALGSWMDGIGLLVMQYAQDIEAWRNQTESMRNAAQAAATNAASSEVAAKKHLDDTRVLIQNFDPVGNLPDETIKNAPLVVATDQGGVRFSDRTLNEGDDPHGFFGIGENQSPRVKELLPMLHAANLYF